MTAMSSLNGKVVFITGGARGVVAEVARRLRRKGAKLVLTDLDPAPLAELADDLDTPKALAAVDGWCTDALTYGGSDAAAPQLVAAAVDALLGVDL